MRYKEQDRLIQYDNLPLAHVLEPETLFDYQQHCNEIQFARRICKQNDYVALAFTEIPVAYLKALGLSEPPASIYFDLKLTLAGEIAGKLMMNPFVIDQSDVMYINYEGCGSIRDENGIMPHMFISRPAQMRVFGFFASVDSPDIEHHMFDLDGSMAGIFQHEWWHLYQATALNFPRQILDYRDLTVFEYALDGYTQKQKDMVRGELEMFGGIVFDQIQGKILRLDGHQQVIHVIADFNAPAYLQPTWLNLKASL